MGRVLGVGGGGTTGGGATTTGGVGGGVAGPGIGGLVIGGRSIGGALEVVLPEPVAVLSSTVMVGGGVGFLVVTTHAPNEAEATIVTTKGEANVRRGARADMR